MIERKVVKVVHPIVKGNPDGFKLVWEDEMLSTDILFDKKVTESVEPEAPVKTKGGAKTSVQAPWAKD